MIPWCADLDQRFTSTENPSLHTRLRKTEVWRPEAPLRHVSEEEDWESSFFFLWNIKRTLFCRLTTSFVPFVLSSWKLSKLCLIITDSSNHFHIYWMTFPSHDTVQHVRASLVLCPLKNRPHRLISWAGQAADWCQCRKITFILLRNSWPHLHKITNLSHGYCHLEPFPTDVRAQVKLMKEMQSREFDAVWWICEVQCHTIQYSLLSLWVHVSKYISYHASTAHKHNRRNIKH